MKSNAFKGVWIHKEVFELDLTLHQKLIFAIIQNLVTDDEPCYASNRYIGEILNLSERQVSRHISLLRQRGFINYKKPRQINGEWEKRKITISHKTHLVKVGSNLSSGREERQKPNQSTYNKELYNKEYNKQNIDLSDKEIKEKREKEYLKKAFQVAWESWVNSEGRPWRRGDKGLTKKWWMVAVSKVGVEAVQDSIDLYFKRTDEQYIKTSHLWFKNERYNEIPPAQEKVRKGFEYVK